MTAAAAAAMRKDTVHDSIIYPGLYAPSGFDMMSILVSNPTTSKPEAQG
jgi:hypothetical protein